MKSLRPNFNNKINIASSSLIIYSKNNIYAYDKHNSIKISTRKMFVYKIQLNPIHASLKYGHYYDIMDR